MINTKENLENEIATINEEFGLEEESGVVTTTSLKVAEVYGKDHADVMKKIRHFIEVIPELNDGNFSLVEYKDGKGEMRPMYRMDRKGFAMLVNKFTGDKALIFTAKYTDAFERMIELISQLKDGTNKLYDIAVSEECQLQRQYDADKVKYAVRNIDRILAESDYTNLEANVEKIIDVHTHLKKKDRYEYHRRLNATDYKQKIVTMIDDKLEAIISSPKSMNPMYRTTAEYVLNNLKRRYIETTHRSTGKKLAYKEAKLKEKDLQIDELKKKIS